MAWSRWESRRIPTTDLIEVVKSLNTAYPIDNSLYELDVMKRGLDVDDWEKTTLQSDRTINWHRLSPAEIHSAVDKPEKDDAAIITPDTLGRDGVAREPPAANACPNL